MSPRCEVLCETELQNNCACVTYDPVGDSLNLVPRASFPLTSGRKTRALGATISGMRHRCRCAVSRITRIRLFPLFFHNGCSQSSRFPTAGQGERSSGNEIATVFNLVPRAHVLFGQHQDTELWNNQQARSQSPRVFRF